MKREALKKFASYFDHNYLIRLFIGHKDVDLDSDTINKINKIVNNKDYDSELCSLVQNVSEEFEDNLLSHTEKDRPYIAMSTVRYLHEYCAQWSRISKEEDIIEIIVNENSFTFGWPDCLIDNSEHLDISDTDYSEPNKYILYLGAVHEYLLILIDELQYIMERLPVDHMIKENKEIKEKIESSFIVKNEIYPTNNFIQIYSTEYVNDSNQYVITELHRFCKSTGVLNIGLTAFIDAVNKANFRQIIPLPKCKGKLKYVIYLISKVIDPDKVDMWYSLSASSLKVEKTRCSGVTIKDAEWKEEIIKINEEACRKSGLTQQKK